MAEDIGVTAELNGRDGMDFAGKLGHGGLFKSCLAAADIWLSWKNPERHSTWRLQQLMDGAWL